MSGTATLGNLGERRILREIIPEYVSAAGDDCANLGLLSGHVVVTTDPVPAPAARVIAGNSDPYWVGWLLVTINASDIAAAGAMPKAFLAALEMPGSTPVNDLRRLLAGIRDSCAANGLKYVGGNLREAPSLAGVGTAIGASSRPPLTRSGASAGDRLVILGDGGRFWADVERIKRGSFVDPMESPVFAPISQARLIHQLHADGLLACAMDTSDGLAPTLEELATVNHIGIRIELATMAGSHTELIERPERLWMGWGDWTVAAAVRSERLEATLEVVNRLGGQMTVIGEFTPNNQGVLLASETTSLPLARLESERFAADSWFSKGVEEYQRMLHALPLPDTTKGHLP